MFGIGRKCSRIIANYDVYHTIISEDKVVFKAIDLFIRPIIPSICNQKITKKQCKYRRKIRRNVFKFNS